MKKKILLLFAALIIVANILHAQGGKLDSSFATNGYAKVNPEDFYTGSFGLVRAMAVNKNNGRIVMAGEGYDGLMDKEYQAMVQLKATGTLDTKFSINGKLNYQPYSDPGFFSGIQSVAVQPDGKTVTMASYNYSDDTAKIVVSRFNKDGTIDGTFGSYGSVYIVYYSTNINDKGGIAIQKDGRIVVAATKYGSSGYSSIIVWRLYDNGSSDGTFNSLGYTDLNTFFPDWSITFSKMVLQKNGEILVAGSGGASGSFKLKYFFVARLQTNGVPDPVFGISGLVTELFGGGTGVACNSIALQKDGKIVAAGLNNTNTGNKFAFMRFNTDGGLDMGFNGTGKLLLPASYYGYANDVAVQDDGKIVAAGYQQVAYGFHNYATVVRITKNGNLDKSFGTNGVATVDSTVSLSSYRCMAIDTSGNIICAGPYNLAGYYVFGAVRYLSNLSLDIAKDAVVYNKNAVAETPVPLIYPNPIQSNATLTYTLDADEKISIALYSINGRLVQTFQASISKNKGTYKEQLNFQPSLPAGNYILTITTSTKKASIKILKQ